MLSDKLEDAKTKRGSIMRIKNFFEKFTHGGKKSVEVLAEEVGAHSNKVIKDIVKVAKEKGINEGNSLYYYSNAIFYEENPGRLYNDLKFIGTFKDPRKKCR